MRFRARLAVFVVPLYGCAPASAPAPASASAPASAPAPGHHAPGHGHHARGSAGAHGFHHRFDDAAAWAKVFDSPERDAWQKPDRVIALLELSPGMVACDIGAGTGYFTMRLARAVGAEGRALGLDVEPDMVRYLGERAKREGLANVEARQVSGGDPKLAPASVDRVLIVDTWHHIDDRPAYARALAAALKPGGRIMIVDYTMDAPDGPPKSARVLPSQAIAELKQGGLAARQIEDASLPRQWVVVGTR